MKNITQILSLVSIAALVLFQTSCKEEHKHEHELALEISYKVGNSNFDSSTVYTIGGTAIKFKTAHFYVSNIGIMDDESRSETFENTYLLVTPYQTEYNLGMISNTDIHHLHEISFNLGIDSVTNHKDPTAATGVLTIQSPSMHWSWNSGYIFLRIDAIVDRDGDGIPETNCFYHIGTDSRLANVMKTTHMDLVDGHNHIMMNFDLANLFTGVNLATAATSTMTADPSLADAIEANIPSAFIIP